MKRLLLIIASSVLLLTGCTKENVTLSNIDGDLQTVTFTTALESGVTTKAVADGDGAAANVNRCIMEVYYDNTLYTRMYAKVTDKKASFTTQMVSNRTYTVAFWADCVDDPYSESGLLADKFYTTNATGGLRAIALKGSYIGNNDARDAFFHVGEYTVDQGGKTFSDIKLKRPFAQMNVITTDWDKVSFIETLKPEKVNVTLKAPLVKFNAVTGEASADSGVPTLNYEAALYASPAAVSPVSATDKTLSMDYLFASAAKEVIDIDWKALHGTNANVEHTFASVPYQRNYRTNIKGALLTTIGKWDVEILPAWDTPDYDKNVVIANTIADAQSIISTSGEPVTVKVTQEAANNATAGDLETVGDKTYVKFVLKTSSPVEVNFDLPEAPATVGSTNVDGWLVTYEDGYPTENVGVNAPAGTKVKILAPDSHVEVTGTSYAEITAKTGDNTLIIPAGVTVASLNVEKGGLEIHGTVNAATVSASDPEKVYVRACENLNQGVYDALKNYIDTENGYTGVQNGSTWDIVIKDNWQYFAAKEFSTVDEGTKTITITSPEELALFAKKINSGNEFVGYKFVIDKDLDMSAHYWQPINFHQPEYKIFEYLDGQNHIISNIKVVGGSSDAYIGFFGSTTSIVLKNIKLDGVDLSYPASAGENARGGALIGTVWGVNVDNCSVKNVTVKASQKLGAFIGYIQGDTNIPNTVTNCSAENVSISSNDPNNILQHGSGGFIGHISQSQNPLTTISGCSVKNITIANYNTAPYTAAELQRVPHVFVGSVCQNYTGDETPTISSHSIVFAGNTISGNNTVLPTCLYSSEFFGWAGNAEERSAWKGVVYIDGAKWVPDYSVTLSCGLDVIGKYGTVGGAVSAYNNATTAGDYAITVKAGTYEVVNVQINQSTTKALTIQARKEGEVFDDVTLKLTGNETAVFKINGISNYNTLPTVIDHFKFDLSSSTGYSYGVYALNGNDVRYTSNLTVSNCDFLGNEADKDGYHCKAGASDSNSSPSNISFIKCTAEKMFSLWTGYLSNQSNGKGIIVKDCTISNSNYFVCETSGDGTIDIDNCDVTVDGAGTRAYAVRYGGNSVDAGGVSINVTNSKFTGGEGYCLFVSWTKSSSPVNLYVDEYTANNVKNVSDTKPRLSDVLNRQTGGTNSTFNVYVNNILKTTLAGTSSSSGDDCNKAFFSAL